MKPRLIFIAAILACTTAFPQTSKFHYGGLVKLPVNNSHNIHLSFYGNGEINNLVLYWNDSSQQDVFNVSSSLILTFLNDSTYTLHPQEDSDIAAKALESHFTPKTKLLNASAYFPIDDAALSFIRVHRVPIVRIQVILGDNKNISFEVKDNDLPTFATDLYNAYYEMMVKCRANVDDDNESASLFHKVLRPQGNPYITRSISRTWGIWPWPFGMDNVRLITSYEYWIGRDNEQICNVNVGDTIIVPAGSYNVVTAKRKAQALNGTNYETFDALLKQKFHWWLIVATYGKESNKYIDAFYSTDDDCRYVVPDFLPPGYYIIYNRDFAYVIRKK